jgi:aspartyl/glutamyl-tRNA(Asn/Gln) amidotransferase C subunit
MQQEQKGRELDVGYVAHLARLHLTAEELKTFQPQMEHIVDYVRQIDTLDVSGVEPTSHAVAVTNILREDRARSGLDGQCPQRGQRPVCRAEDRRVMFICDQVRPDSGLIGRGSFAARFLNNKHRSTSAATLKTIGTRLTGCVHSGKVAIHLRSK